MVRRRDRRRLSEPPKGSGERRVSGITDLRACTPADAAGVPSSLFPRASPLLRLLILPPMRSLSHPALSLSVRRNRPPSPCHSSRRRRKEPSTRLLLPSTSHSTFRRSWRESSRSRHWPQAGHPPAAAAALSPPAFLLLPRPRLLPGGGHSRHTGLPPRGASLRWRCRPQGGTSPIPSPSCRFIARR